MECKRVCTEYLHDSTELASTCMPFEVPDSRGKELGAGFSIFALAPVLKEQDELLSFHVQADRIQGV